MITKLRIKNFKLHADTELELKNLNILTGLNGSGKSSVIQSLLLLRQSDENNVLSDGLQLNKPYCSVGVFKDALYQYAENDEIDFIIDSEEYGNQNWKFKPSDKNYYKNFIPLVGKASEKLKELSLFNSNFQYLSAARLSPQESYPLDSYAVESKRELSIIKGQGELVVHFLYYYGVEKKERIKDVYLKHRPLDSEYLIDQTTAWEREISPDVNVQPEQVGKSFALNYTFNRKNDFATTESFSAENVGFGLSYALPIIVAMLSSEKNSLLLIENPEAHLHPKGQHKLAELIALAAQSGVQLIIETHSEHIINGILVACKKFEDGKKGISRDLVRIYQFKRDSEKHCAVTQQIKILKGGKVDKQPEDFFDQTDKDLNFLLGF